MPETIKLCPPTAFRFARSEEHEHLQFEPRTHPNAYGLFGKPKRTQREFDEWSKYCSHWQTMESRSQTAKEVARCIAEGREDIPYPSQIELEFLNASRLIGHLAALYRTTPIFRKEFVLNSAWHSEKEIARYPTDCSTARGDEFGAAILGQIATRLLNYRERVHLFKSPTPGVQLLFLDTEDELFEYKTLFKLKNDECAKGKAKFSYEFDCIPFSPVFFDRGFSDRYEKQYVTWCRKHRDKVPSIEAGPFAPLCKYGRLFSLVATDEEWLKAEGHDCWEVNIVEDDKLLSKVELFMSDLLDDLESEVLAALRDLDVAFTTDGGPEEPMSIPTGQKAEFAERNDFRFCRDKDRTLHIAQPYRETVKARKLVSGKAAYDSAYGEWIELQTQSTEARKKAFAITDWLKGRAEPPEGIHPSDGVHESAVRFASELPTISFWQMHTRLSDERQLGQFEAPTDPMEYAMMKDAIVGNIARWLYTAEERIVVCGRHDPGEIVCLCDTQRGSIEYKSLLHITSEDQGRYLILRYTFNSMPFLPEFYEGFLRDTYQCEVYSGYGPFVELTCYGHTEARWASSTQRTPQNAKDDKRLKELTGKTRPQYKEGTHRVMTEIQQHLLQQVTEAINQLTRTGPADEGGGPEAF